MKRMSQKELGKLIQDTKDELARFTRNIKKAPRESRSEYKSWARKNKVKLKFLEECYKSGKWKL